MALLQQRALWQRNWGGGRVAQVDKQSRKAGGQVLFVTADSNRCSVSGTTRIFDLLLLRM